MPNYIEIAKMRSHEFSQRVIAKTLGLSRNTVAAVFHIMDLNRLNYEEMVKTPPEQLKNLFESKKDTDKVYVQPDYPQLAK